MKQPILPIFLVVFVAIQQSSSTRNVCYLFSTASAPRHAVFKTVGHQSAQLPAIEANNLMRCLIRGDLLMSKAIKPQRKATFFHRTRTRHARSSRRKLETPRMQHKKLFPRLTGSQLNWSFSHQHLLLTSTKLKAQGKVVNVTSNLIIHFWVTLPFLQVSGRRTPTLSRSCMGFLEA